MDDPQRTRSAPQTTRLSRLHGHLGFLNNILLIPLFTIMALELVAGTARERLMTLATLNLGFCAVFLAEWVVGLVVAEKKLRYLVSLEKVLDLVSSIPFGYFFQGMRIARLVRVVRVVRLIVRARRFRGASARVLRALSIMGATVFAGAVGLRIVEPETVPTLADSFWWSLVTLSTVGYGDILPVTGLGRIVAGVLIFFGIGVFGYIAAFMTSLMTDPEEDEILATVKRLETQVAALTELVAAQQQHEPGADDV